jgi:TetR/AcrR family transcriptional repressor of nem operon
LNDLVSDYLSERHRADRADGCAIAALGAEMARQDEGLRRSVTAHVRAQLDGFSHLMKGGAAASRRKRAIATLAGIVGALMLARAVEDAALSDEILTTAREAFGEGRFGEGRPSSQND